jgi:predicted nucleic acid-binding protein
MLEIFVGSNDIIIPRKVYEEVTRGKEKGREDAFLIEKLVNENKIKIEEVDRKKSSQIEQIFRLRAGENEVLTLCLEKPHVIVTDDKKCMNAVKALNKEFITTPDIIIALFDKKRIGKKDILLAFDILENFGWYKKEIIQKYRGMIK